MMKMATGLAWILAFLVGSGYFNPDTFLTEKYKQLGIPSRIFRMYMMNVVARMKYYGVWTLTEGACIMAGIGYKGLDAKTGKPNWDRLTNIRPLGVELAQNSHAYLGNWNINTNNWLRNYMFLRVTPKGKKPGFRATLATFVTSAFWHGFYPGYYLTFVLAAFMQNTAKSEYPLQSRKRKKKGPHTNLIPRRSTPPTTLRLVTRRHQTPPYKALLRHLLLVHHAIRLLLRHNTVHSPHFHR
jgi:lysophospholipid acyltransferase